VSRDVGTSEDFDAPTGALDNREPSTD